MKNHSFEIFALSLCRKHLKLMKVKSDFESLTDGLLKVHLRSFPTHFAHLYFYYFNASVLLLLAHEAVFVVVLQE